MPSKKGSGPQRSTTKESKISRDRTEINLILKSIRDVAKACGLDTSCTTPGDNLIYGKKGIENDNSFSIFAYDDYSSGYVVKGIKGFYNTYMPDLRACDCILQFKVNLKSDPLSTILLAYARIARTIAKYTKEDKSAWSKFSTEVFKIDLDKLKSDKESAKNNAKKEAENYLKIMESKVKKTGAKILEKDVFDYTHSDKNPFEPYIIFSFNDSIYGGVAKRTSGKVELTLSSRKMDHSDIGFDDKKIKTYGEIKNDCSNIDSVIKKSVKAFQGSIKELYESTLKDYNNAMKVKV